MFHGLAESSFKVSYNNKILAFSSTNTCLISLRQNQGTRWLE